MVATLSNNTKPELDDFYLKYFWQPTEYLAAHANSNLNDPDDNARMEEERLQEWRANMIKIRQSN
jgi:hypothetical protein